MIQNVEIYSPVHLFDLNNKVELRDDFSDPVLITKKNTNFFCPAISQFTNIGFRYAYFLWIMRGANIVEQLDYYSPHLHHNTDDDLTLRGAYGPRLKYWVGADQIAEANKINSDIEDSDDFVKPKGIDQLHGVFTDLKSGMGTSVISIFNPSLDFEDSNDVPNLISMVFTYRHEKLNLYATFSESFINGQFVNDYSFLAFLQVCMTGWLKGEVGELSVMVSNPIYQPQNDIEICNLDLYGTGRDVPVTGDMDFWNYIIALSNMERHLRKCVNEQTINNQDVSVSFLTGKLIDVCMKNIDNQFWREVGYILIIYSIIKHGGLVDESLREFITSLLTNGFKESTLRAELIWWLYITLERKYGEFTREIEDLWNGKKNT